MGKRNREGEKSETLHKAHKKTEDGNKQTKIYDAVIQLNLLSLQLTKYRKMEDNYKTIEKIYLLIIEIRKDIEKAKMSWWKNPSNTDITVLKKLIEAEEKLHNITKILQKIILSYNKQNETLLHL